MSNTMQNIEDSTQTPLGRVLEKLNNSVETGHKHPYLIDHEVANFDLTLDKDGNLLGIGVNLRESFIGDSYRPKAQTILNISPEGRATLERGVKFFGSALMIGHREFRKLAKSPQNPSEPSVIYVAVDYPTGAFLHTKTGWPVAVAFKNANVKSVVSFFKKRFPQARVVACLGSEESKYSSRNKAAKAVLKLGGLVSYPTFNKYEKHHGLISFNDLCMVHGHEAALLRLRQGIQGENA
ncbi:MAG: hypothetical protein LBV79_00180 [Candidatus Adiutrix sp.]|jgi:hypothetical protein|nr:hypothetical protein [Candidatus Adiutrix sp.]